MTLFSAPVVRTPTTVLLLVLSTMCSAATPSVPITGVTLYSCPSIKTAFPLLGTESLFLLLINESVAASYTHVSLYIVSSSPPLSPLAAAASEATVAAIVSVFPSRSLSPSKRELSVVAVAAVAASVVASVEASVVAASVAASVVAASVEASVAA